MKQRKEQARARRETAPPASPPAADRSRRRWWLWVALAVLLGSGALFINAMRPQRVPVRTCRVISTFPHDARAFCQGLLHAHGNLYESTGLHGQSTLRRVRLETGEVLQSVALETRYFGEGLVLWQDRLIQLTWQDHTAFVYDVQSFKRIGEFTYPGEGWGITHDGQHLIMSDGTSELRFLDPESFRELRRVRVTADDRPVTQLNELEYVNGDILANVWQSDFIARIDPQSGAVKEWLDLTGLLSAHGGGRGADVLNGIAYDPDQKRLFVTGKNWPKLFAIEIAR